MLYKQRFRKPIYFVLDGDRCFKAWFPYNRPGRLNRSTPLKMCSDDQDNLLGTPLMRRMAIQTTATRAITIA